MSRYEDDTVGQVVDALDTSNQQLPTHIREDIRLVRQQAMRDAKAVNGKKTRTLRLPQLAWVGAPAAVALTFIMLVNYPGANDIPALPADMLFVEIPSEDLALLEDLEFAQWLAQQQQVLL
jgi:hypothetical protein